MIELFISSCKANGDLGESTRYRRGKNPLPKAKQTPTRPTVRSNVRHPYLRAVHLRTVSQESYPQLRPVSARMPVAAIAEVSYPALKNSSQNDGPSIKCRRPSKWNNLSPRSWRQFSVDTAAKYSNAELWVRRRCELRPIVPDPQPGSEAKLLRRIR